MLHLFNRTVLLDAASIDKQVRIRDFLISNGFEVYVKMMVHMLMQAAASRLGDKFGERKADGIYSIYVKRKELSVIKILIKQERL